jgi:Sulfate permease family
MREGSPATAVAPLAAGDPIRYGALAGVVAILVGVMLLAAGWMRLGVVAKLLTRPVLLGYQAGLALVVVFSQIPRLLGLRDRYLHDRRSGRDRPPPGQSRSASASRSCPVHWEHGTGASAAEISPRVTPDETTVRTLSELRSSEAFAPFPDDLASPVRPFPAG